MGTSFEYAIQPHSAQIFRVANPSGQTASASVRATPARGTTPQALLLSTFTSDGKTTAAAAVPALRASTGFRVPVQAAGMPGQPGSIGTGLAIANTSDEEVRVSLEIIRPDGSLAPPLGSLTLPPWGHLPHAGRDHGSAREVLFRAAAGERHRTGSGGCPADPVQPARGVEGDLDQAVERTQDRWFAHLADTEAWTTELVLFSGTVGETSSGNLCLFWFPVP